MKYKDQSRAYSSNYEFNDDQSDQIDGTVDTPHGIVKVYSTERLQWSLLEFVYNRRSYDRSCDNYMNQNALIRAAHKFARDVVAGRVK